MPQFVRLRLAYVALVLGYRPAAIYGDGCAIFQSRCEDPGRSPAIPPLTSPLAYGNVKGFLSWRHYAMPFPPLVTLSSTVRGSMVAQPARKSAETNPSARVLAKTAQPNCHRARLNPSPDAPATCTNEFLETAQTNPAATRTCAFRTGELPPCTSEPERRRGCKMHERTLRNSTSEPGSRSFDTCCSNDLLRSTGEPEPSAILWPVSTAHAHANPTELPSPARLSP